MLRISASCLRFVLVVYVYVHSLQQSRTLLELLASTNLPLRTVSGVIYEASYKNERKHSLQGQAERLLASTNLPLRTVSW